MTIFANNFNSFSDANKIILEKLFHVNLAKQNNLFHNVDAQNYLYVNMLNASVI
jgi:hypothetical protein